MVEWAMEVSWQQLVLVLIAWLVLAVFLGWLFGAVMRRNNPEKF